MGKKSKNKKKQKLKQESNTQQSGAIAQSKIDKKDYEAEIFKLQVELVKLQEWSRRPTPALSLFSKDEMLPAKAA
jgi:polyphosphate kinase 2 (PPK2 family)